MESKTPSQPLIDSRMTHACNLVNYSGNFLQVDVFYNELNYVRVEQQETFPFLSLLSEVGGFMGLLLGASVLTVCELVDYIVLTVTSRCVRWSTTSC